MEDPFPKVAGGGVNHLKNAGLEVDQRASRPCGQAELTLSQVRIHGKPWIIAKWAMTADGKITTHR